MIFFVIFEGGILMTATHVVFQAEPYQYGEMGSLGKASYMLLRQFQFPNEYEEKDTLISADHDRCLMWDYAHVCECFKKHMNTGEMGLGHWINSAFDEKVIDFLKDILKADTEVVWTGYRVMGTVNRSNGYPVYTLELFAKHAESKTTVYTGANAPNVSQPSVFNKNYGDYSKHIMK